MLYGYMGKLLHVYLESGDIKEEALDPSFTRDFIGGYGLMSRILYDLIPAKADPLGADNILAVATGPLTASGVPSGTRWSICCKSPLTGTWGDANGSGFFGPKLKEAGFDGILFHGISQDPVILVIDNGKAELKDASSLWGMDSYAVEEQVKDTYGKKTESICIGPAGEKLSLISGVVTARGRIAARSGVGAVMGSKKLKAIIAIGDQKLPLADEPAVKSLIKKYTDQIRKEDVGLSNFYCATGTPGYIEAGLEAGDSPVMNWKGSAEDFPQIDKIGHETIFERGRRKRTCWHCPVGCWGEVPFKDATVHQPEYETAAMLGPNLLLSDLDSLMKIVDVCNRNALDTISLGAVLAFATEIYQEGIITSADTDGLELKWGDAEAYIELTEKIASRDGFGDVLADGVKRAAEIIKKGSEKFAMHVGGQEIPAHDPRFEPGMGLVYIADATPGKHGQASQYIPPDGFDIGPFPGFGIEREKQEDRGRYMKLLGGLSHVMNAAGFCLFGYLSTTHDYLQETLTAVTGIEYSLEDLLTCGERIANMRQAFNIREGINLLAYDIPERVYGSPPAGKGPTRGFTVDIKNLLREHLEEMDWDQTTAIPSRKKLEALGLSKIADDIKAR